ncbi:MAG: hypothetical protein WAM04_04530 [Candidatus Sulfotelmatobacter sp.]
MSGANRNFVLAYAFLVILPLVGLAGILKAGRNVTAPVSIDGLWTMRVDSTQIDSLPCSNALATLPDKTLAITQSGRSLVLTFPSGPKLTASGTLDGARLRADLRAAESSDSSCVTGGEMLLLASIDRKVDSNLLTGTLSVPNCQSCASVGFQAERQTPAASKGGH